MSIILSTTHPTILAQVATCMFYLPAVLPNQGGHKIPTIIFPDTYLPDFLQISQQNSKTCLTICTKIYKNTANTNKFRRYMKFQVTLRNVSLTVP